VGRDADGARRRGMLPTTALICLARTILQNNSTWRYTTRVLANCGQDAWRRLPSLPLPSRNLVLADLYICHICPAAARRTNAWREHGAGQLVRNSRSVHERRVNSVGNLSHVSRKRGTSTAATNSRAAFLPRILSSA